MKIMDLLSKVGDFANSISKLFQLIGITINIQPRKTVYLKKGQSMIVSEFQWRKFRLVKYIVTMQDDGSVKIYDLP